MSEETKTADRGAAKNLIISTYANSAYGFCFLMAILFSTQVSSPLIDRLLPPSIRQDKKLLTIGSLAGPPRFTHMHTQIDSSM